MDNTVHDNLNSYIKSLYPNISESELSALSKEVSCTVYKKNSLLVRQGDIAANCYFILKGCLRLFYVDGEGNEFTSGFFIENESVSILDSYRYGKISPYSIDCIEDCILVEGNLEQEEEMRKRNPSLGYIIQRALEEELNRNQSEQALFRSLPPEKRYLEFLKTRPGLAARVSQYQLASCLGIKPESLSRIKRRITSSLT